MKFLIYNAEGLTLPVEAEPGLPFNFECGEEECGKIVRISGVIIQVSEDRFTEVLSRTLEENPDFSRISEITARNYIFSGEVNGKKVELPAETLEDFAKRFMEEVLVLR
ncbi:MAG: hypothetical protein PWQ79_781 [Thermococcaceae archaeon]|nr:hypothetical protein [Thermococcaceae archaeon]MDK2913866.1 hypothetical protein [Thermococcaceae archaeon]